MLRYVYTTHFVVSVFLYYIPTHCKYFKRLIDKSREFGLSFLYIVWWCGDFGNNEVHLAQKKAIN